MSGNTKDNRIKTKHETQNKDVHTVSEKDFLPRNIDKSLNNQYGKINTNVNDRISKTVGNSSSGFTNHLTSGGRVALDKVKASLHNSEDLGTQAIYQTTNAVDIGYASFKASQAVSPIMTGAVTKTGRGTFEVSTVLGKTALTIANTAKTMQYKNQLVSIKKDGLTKLVEMNLQEFKQQAKNTGLTNTAIVSRIISTTKKLQNSSDRIKTGIINTKENITRSYKFVKGVYRGIVEGKVTSQVAYEALKKARLHAMLGVRTGIVKGGKITRKALFKGTYFTANTAKTAIPNTVKMGGKGILGAASVLSSADDIAVQAVGNAVVAGNIGIKTTKEVAKLSTHASIATLKKGKNISKTTWNGLRFAYKKGIREAWNTGIRKASGGLLGAGKSLVSATINAVKMAGAKIVIPLLIICVCFVGMSSTVSSPIMAISSIFGGSFGTPDGKDIDVREFLMDSENGIPALSNAYINKIKNDMNNSKQEYDIVRFYSNEGVDGVLDSSESGIRSVFPKDDELVNMIQPIFNAVLLMEYDLEPTEQEALDLEKSIFNTLFRVSKKSTVEYCGQSLKNGEGKVKKHDCGHVHALDNCPNIIKGVHNVFTCKDCCYKYCDGHKKTKTYVIKNSELEEFLKDFKEDEIVSKKEINKKETEVVVSYLTYCDGCKSKCNGYKYCGGHKVLSITLNIDGTYELLAKYFTNPIEELSNKKNRTEAEEQKLADLKDYYEICLEMMKMVSSDYGSGISMDDLDGVKFVDGERKGNKAIVDKALSQVGQVGGQPYWSYYGFNSRVEWCACFVHWVMKTSEYGKSYPTTANNAYCPTVANWFKENGRWGSRDYKDLVSGDVIFFDWEGDGITDHIGIVIGRDNEKVYTVEGNSGDAVRVNTYPIGSTVIYGYALMNY